MDVLGIIISKCKASKTNYNSLCLLNKRTARATVRHYLFMSYRHDVNEEHNELMPWLLSHLRDVGTCVWSVFGFPSLEAYIIALVQNPRIHAMRDRSVGTISGMISCDIRSNSEVYRLLANRVDHTIVYASMPYFKFEEHAELLVNWFNQQNPPRDANIIVRHMMEMRNEFTVVGDHVDVVVQDPEHVELLPIDIMCYASCHFMNSRPKIMILYDHYRNLATTVYGIGMPYVSMIPEPKRKEKRKVGLMNYTVYMGAVAVHNDDGDGPPPLEEYEIPMVDYVMDEVD